MSTSTTANKSGISRRTTPRKSCVLASFRKRLGLLIISGLSPNKGGIDPVAFALAGELENAFSDPENRTIANDLGRLNVCLAMFAEEAAAFPWNSDEDPDRERRIIPLSKTERSILSPLTKRLGTLIVKGLCPLAERVAIDWDHQQADAAANELTYDVETALEDMANKGIDFELMTLHAIIGQFAGTAAGFDVDSDEDVANADPNDECYSAMTLGFKRTRETVASAAEDIPAAKKGETGRRGAKKSR